MQLTRPIVSQHRLQRYILWTLALLSWIAAVLAGRRAGARHIVQRGDISIAWLTRRVTNLIALRAIHLGRFKRRAPLHWRYGRDLRRRHFRRSLLGAKLRRALKHKDLATHIARLIAVLRNLDAYAAQFARNLRRRRRLWREAPPVAPADALLGSLAPPPAFANSS